MLLTTTLLLAVAAKPFPVRFCEAWRKAAPKARSYEDALIATAEAAQPTGPWERPVEALFSTNPLDHFAILEGEAKDRGEKFVCPEFQFPRGKSAGKAALEGEAGGAVVGLAADERTLFVLTCPKNACELHALEGEKWRVVASGLGGRAEGQVYDATRLVVGGDELFVIVQGAVLAVKAAGGAPRTLAKGLTRPHHLVLDGDQLWFADGEEIKSVARTGGPVTTAFASVVPTMGSKEPVWFRKVGDGLAFIVWEGPLLVAQEGKVTPVTSLRRAIFSPVTLDGALYAPGAGNLLARLDLTSGKETPVTKKPTPLGELIAGLGELLTVAAEDDWRKHPSILSWRPGASDFQVLVKNAGAPRYLAANGKQVWWFDEGQRVVMAAPRK